MNKLLFALPALLGMFGLGAVAMQGCADACDDMAALCGRCTDAHYAQACRDIVNAENQDVCAGEQQVFERYCFGEGGAGPGGNSGGPCPPRQFRCAEQCVDIQANPTFCGSCLNTCGSDTPLCAAGTCVATCPANLPTECSGGCVDVNGGDPNNCGGCGTTCPQGQVCADGACADGCDPMSATPTACSGGCVDLSSDVQHCGSCDNACAAGQSCTDGNCNVCPGGFDQCGTACVRLDSDPNHCGQCGHVCAGTQKCSMGSCQAVCGLGLTACGPTQQSCVDASSDPNSCGASCTVCAVGEVCSNGVCTSACAAGQMDCSGACVDLASNPFHCGGCHASCADANLCTADSCLNSTCNNLGGGTSCSDGDACTGDTCDPIQGCMNEPYTQQEIETLCQQTMGMDPSTTCVWCDPSGVMCNDGTVGAFSCSVANGMGGVTCGTCNLTMMPPTCTTTMACP